MVGDYNLPKLIWIPSSIGFFPSLSNLTLTESEFLSKLSFLNIFQFNHVVNNNGSILDLILSDANNSTNSYATSHLNAPYLENPTRLTIHSLIIFIKPPDVGTQTYKS